MLEQVKKLFEAVDLVHKTLDAIAWVAAMVLPLAIISSQTIRYLMGAGAFVGGMLGYYLTVSRWAGQGREVCLHRRNAYFGFLWLPLVVVVITFLVLEPDIAARNLFLRDLRELLLNAMLLPNLIISLGTLFMSFFLIGAITLNSPKLWGYLFP